MASLIDLIQSDQQNATDPTAGLPRFSQVAAPQGSTTRNALAAGVSSGVDQIQATGGAFMSAIGKLLGSTSLEDWGKGVYQRNSQEAAANGRSDLDKPIWDVGLTELPSWIGYRTSQQVPQWATQILGGAVLGRAAKAAGLALPEAAAELGARAPKTIGGGGFGFKSAGPLTKEALEEGQKYATDVAGAAVAGYPMAVGSMYGEAIDRGDAGRGDAAKAAILGPAYAALDAMEPAFLKNKLLKGSTGTLATRLLTNAFAGAALEMPQEAVQTAMEQSFRSDLSPMEKFRNIVDAAVTGGVVGGFAGGIGGIRRAKSPSDVSNDELKSDMDATMGNAKAPAPQLKLTGDQTAEEQAAARPFSKEPLDRVQGMLADVESRMTSGGGTQQDAVNRQQLRNEVAARIAEQQPERPFASVPDADLQTGLQAATARGQQDIVGSIQQELAARQQDTAQLRAAVKIGPNERQMFQPTTPELPGLDLKDQATPAIAREQADRQQALQEQNVAARQAEQAQSVAQVHQELADMAGLKSIPKTFAKVGIQTQEDGLGYVADRLQQGNAPKWVTEVGKKIGLLDDKGQDQSVDDLKAKLAKVDDKLTNSFQSFGDTKQQYAARIELQKQKTAITQQIDLAQRAEAAAVVRAQERNPPKEVAPGPAQMRAPNGTMTQVQVLEKAPIKQDGKLYQPVRTSQGQEVNVPIASLYPSAPSKVEAKATSPAPTKTEAARGPLPLTREESGGPIPNELKSPLWQNNPVAQREGLTPLRGEGEVAAQIGRSSEVAPKSVSAVPAPLTQEEALAASRDINRYEPILGEIVSNKALPTGMRRDAREARDLLRNGAGYQEALDKVLSDYSAHTGDMQYMRSPIENTTVYGQGQQNLQNAGLAATLQARFDRRQAAMTPEQQATEQAATEERNRQLWANDAQKFADNPDGPFANATRNVITSKSMDPRYGEFLSDLMHTLGLGNIRVFMFHPDDRQQEAYNLYGPYKQAAFANVRGMTGGISPFGPGNKDFMMVFQKGLSPERMIEAVAHEMGHMIWHVMLAKADAATKAALRNDFLDWLKTNKGKRLQDVVKALRNRYTANANLNEMAQTVKDTIIAKDDDYLLDENEWFADGVSRWVTTSMKPLSVVDKFFSKVAQMMKALLKFVSGQGYLPPQSIKSFMDSMGPSSIPIDWQGMTSRYTLVGDYSYRTSDKAPIDAMLSNIGNLNGGALHDRLKQIIQKSDSVQSLLEKLPWAETSNNINKLHLYSTTLEHITQFFGPLFKPGTLENYRDLHRLQRSVQGRLAHVMTIPYNTWDKLNTANKKAGQGVLDLMHYTFGDIDPRKRWEEHEHLKGASNEQLLRSRVAEANKLYSEMQRIVVDGVRASTVYDNLVTANEADRFAAQTVALYNLVNANASVDQPYKDTLSDPMQKYMQNASVYEDINASREYWKSTRDALISSVGGYIEAQEGRLGSVSKAEASKIKADGSSLVGLMKEIDQQDKLMKQAPYFHVGRFGNYFASFRLSTNDEGTVPQANLEKIAKLINDGKFALSVPLETVKDRIFARFETADEANRFEKLMVKLEKEQLLTREPRNGSQDNQEPKLGQRGTTPLSEEPMYAAALISSLRQRMEESAILDDLSAEEIEQRKKIVQEQVNHIHQFFQNMIPDASILKVNLQRQGIGGFTPDMMRSYAFRAGLGAEALAGVYTAPMRTDALKEIHAQVDSAKVLGETGAKQRYTMQNVLFELQKREANRGVMSRNSFFDMLRAVNHNFLFALNPAYAVLQMVQIPAYTLPELSKKHGVVKSFEAIRQVTPMAFRILRATIQNGYEGSWVQALDATITSAVLEKAKVPVSDREFIMRMANSGLFDLGSQSRELGRVTEGRQRSNFDVAMRVGSSFGFYAEMLGRIITALAAKKLYDGPTDGLEKYARNVVISSMFDFSQGNTSRAMSRHGVLGSFTPVAAALKSYTQQVLETLGREMHTAFVNKAATPQQKKEARTFLGAHMAAMAFFAGSLGLPAASVIAVAINKMADILGDDDEPYDVKVAYRNFLASIFGKGIGEVLARGVPRAIGFDISQRAGEADILPFSRLLSDRRQWKDAFRDYVFGTTGAPVSVFGNVVEGAGDIASGDLVQGAQRFFPQFVKSGLEAYKMTSRGYTDTQGNALPMDPGATDILYQLLGFAPAGRAEYDEERRAYQATRGQMIRMASDYRRDLADAIESGDTETASQMIADIKRFDELNPAYAVLPSIGQTLARRARERVGAQQSGAPMGVPMALQEQYSFGNVR